ncbi:MAG: glycosyltransferase [Erysipelotrichia bacterium]|nr:glycosyltransferase [Erysipelotrichia bacterium]
MRILTTFMYFNAAVVIVMTAAYLYQTVYMFLGFKHRHVEETPKAKKNHCYAVFISARNEEGVIGELIDSLNKQKYPKELFDIYVLADNCTDHTAQVSKEHGAAVYERQNQEQVGKGYALDFLYRKVIERKGDGYYDAFMVFDADNIVDENFIAEMNKTFDTGRYDAITSYRNSKNFGSTWLSAAYSIWFLREARYVNYPRSLIGTTCMISGTGFLVSSRIMKENDGWPYHMLTEDIQFSVNCALDRKMIGYCDHAMVYDEQPTTWKQSFKQRLRWSKGFYQIDGEYVGSLLKRSFSKDYKGYRLGCYDVLMTVLPAVFLTLAVFAINIWAIYSAGSMPYYVKLLFRQEAFRYLSFAVINYYIGMIIIGGLTVGTEWKRIPASNWEKIKYLWIFPLFIASYIPITLKALFCKVDWQPIEHNSAKVFGENI